MALLDKLPWTESLGVFLGYTGIDWLHDGQTNLAYALVAALIAAVLFSLARKLGKTLPGQKTP